MSPEHGLGLRVKYDLLKPEGERVASVEARCGTCKVPRFEPLNATAKYGIMVSEFLFQGGGGYTIFKDVHIDDQEKLDWREIQAFRAYATKTTPFCPGLEGRIEFLNPQATSVIVEELTADSGSSSYFTKFTLSSAFVLFLATFLNSIQDYNSII